MSSTISFEDFLLAAKDFMLKSDKLNDGWSLNTYKDDTHKTYLKKESYVNHEIDKISILLKVEYVVFYNLSYGVPSFSFNIWNSCGSLLSLEDVRKMSFIQMNQKEFYTVVTQQEHPIFQRPYYVVHPCHTEELLAALRNNSNNIIVSFLGLVTPLVKFNLPIEYGL